MLISTKASLPFYFWCISRRRGSCSEWSTFQTSTHISWSCVCCYFYKYRASPAFATCSTGSWWSRVVHSHTATALQPIQVDEGRTLNAQQRCLLPLPSPLRGQEKLSVDSASVLPLYNVLSSEKGKTGDTSHTTLRKGFLLIPQQFHARFCLST